MIKDKRLPLKQEFLVCYRKLPMLKLAGAYIGKSDDTITNWKKEDSDFSERIVRAKVEWVTEKVKTADPKWLLKRIIGEEFADKKEVDNGVNARLEEALDRLAKLLPK